MIGPKDSGNRHFIHWAMKGLSDGNLEVLLALVYGEKSTSVPGVTGFKNAVGKTPLEYARQSLEVTQEDGCAAWCVLYLLCFEAEPDITKAMQEGTFELLPGSTKNQVQCLYGPTQRELLISVPHHSLLTIGLLEGH